MKWKVYTVPAALLALLCTACNGRYDRAKLEAKVPVASAMRADSSRVAFEEPKIVADDEQKEAAPPSPDQPVRSQYNAPAPPPVPAPD